MLFKIEKGCGIGGWWKRLRIVWGGFLLHDLLEVSIIILSGLLQVLTVQMTTMTGKCFRTNWLCYGWARIESGRVLRILVPAPQVVSIKN